MNLTYTVSNNTHCHSQAIMKFIGTCMIFLRGGSKTNWSYLLNEIQHLLYCLKILDRILNVNLDFYVF